MMISETRKQIEERISVIVKETTLCYRVRDLQNLQECMQMMLNNNLMTFEDFKDLLKETNDWLEMCEDIFQERIEKAKEFRKNKQKLIYGFNDKQYAQVGFCEAIEIYDYDVIIVIKCSDTFIIKAPIEMYECL